MYHSYMYYFTMSSKNIADWPFSKSNQIPNYSSFSRFPGNLDAIN